MVNYKSNVFTYESEKIYKTLTPIYTFGFNDVLSFQFRSRLNAPGMYRIVNTENNVFYLGTSGNLMTRCNCHRNHLRIKTHDNILLQDDYDMFGPEVFKIEILKLSESVDEQNNLILDESKILLYCRKVNIHIYNIYIKPFNKIKGNYVAKLINKEASAKRFSREWVIVYPDGKEENIVNLRDFCRKNGLRHGPLIDVSDGVIESYKGYKCKRGIGNLKRKTSVRPHLSGEGSHSSKKWKIIFPNGDVEVVRGLSGFCIENNLKCNAMYEIARRKNGKAHHGFSCQILDE